MDTDVVIIGAGPAGLAAAYELKERGIKALIFEKSSQVGTPWRNRHDQLCLNTYRDLSDLPGLKMPSDYPSFPTRDQFVAYLESYVQFLNLPIEYDTYAQKIKQQSGGWQVKTNHSVLSCRHVIVSTGSDKVPFTPNWPGKTKYQGTFIHSGAFHHAEDYAGKSVLLVGAGNSSIDIGNYLVKEKIKPSWLSVRGGNWFGPKEIFGFAIHPLAIYARGLPLWMMDLSITLANRLLYGSFSKLGLPKPKKGAATRAVEEFVVPALDDGFMAGLKAGQFTVVPEIKNFTETSVELSDGQILKPDVIICGTGYQFGLEPLLGHLDVLDKRGFPLFYADQQSDSHPGLWFLGHNTSLFGNMYIRREESNQLAIKISRMLEIPLKEHTRQTEPEVSLN